MAKALADIRRIFSDDNFKFVDPRTRKQYCFPNSWMWNEKEQISALVVWRSDAGEDFAINKFALEHFVGALKKGTVRECFLVLADGKEGFSPVLIAHSPVQFIYNNLKDQPTSRGQFGDYWWVNERFTVIFNPNKISYVHGKPF